MQEKKFKKKECISEIRFFARLTILAIARYTGELYFEFPIPDNMDSVEQAEFEGFLESYKFISYLIAQIQYRLFILRKKNTKYTASERKELYYEFSTIRYISGIIILMDGSVIADYSTIGNDEMEPVKDLSDNVSMIQDYIKDHFKSYSDIKYAKQMQRLQELYNRVLNLTIISFLLSNDSYLVFNGTDWTAQAILTAQTMQQNATFMLEYLSVNKMKPFCCSGVILPQDITDFENLFSYELRVLSNDIQALTKETKKTEETRKRFFEYSNHLKISKNQEIELIQQYQRK